MPSYSLCCLSSINLTKFVKSPFTDNAEFDLDSFQESVKTGIRFLDNVLDKTDYPLQKIEDFSKQWRRIGLGFTGLGDAFIRMGMKYGSKESKDLSHKIGQTLRDYSYLASTELAQEKGKFPAYDEKVLDATFVKTLSPEVQSKIKKYGLRNIGLNTIAPTGTTSFSLGNNCSSGVEPAFALEYTRKIRKSHDSDDTRSEIVYDEAWLDYQCLDENFGREVTAPDYFVTTSDIDVHDAIDIQAIFQEYIDHSISKTLNLPVQTSYEAYQSLFMEAYDKGLKGFTTFNPDGSMKGVLEITPSSGEQDIDICHAPKRPKELQCDIHSISVKGEKFIALVGLYNNRPYEIFVTDEPPAIPKKAKVGIIKKVSKNQYDLIIDSQTIVEDLSKNFSHKEHRTLNRFISMPLRHRVPLQYIVEQTSKSEDFSAYEKVLGRILKKYIIEGEKVLSKETCPECGSSLEYREGCKSCTSCFWSKCS